MPTHSLDEENKRLFGKGCPQFDSESIVTLSDRYDGGPRIPLTIKTNFAKDVQTSGNPDDKSALESTDTASEDRLYIHPSKFSPGSGKVVHPSINTTLEAKEQLRGRSHAAWAVDPHGQEGPSTQAPPPAEPQSQEPQAEVEPRAEAQSQIVTQPQTEIRPQAETSAAPEEPLQAPPPAPQVPSQAVNLPPPPPSSSSTQAIPTDDLEPAIHAPTPIHHQQIHPPLIFDDPEIAEQKEKVQKRWDNEQSRAKVTMGNALAGRESAEHGVVQIDFAGPQPLLSESDAEEQAGEDSPP